MKKSKAGFSLIEVMVTFVIITIVSITAFSIFSTSGNGIISAVYEKKATVYLTNALEVYKYYGTEDDVLEKLGLSNSEPDSDSYYSVNVDGYTVKFRIDEENVFSGSCQKGDKVVLEISLYKKGGVQNENP